MQVGEQEGGYRRRNLSHENLYQAIFRSEGVIIMRMGGT